jgi:hypothetical protein
MTVSKCPERAETTTHRKHYPKLTMATARIFDGAAWTDITDSEAVHTVDHAQVAPILDGDGNIFVSIPTFRGVWFVENDQQLTTIRIWSHPVSSSSMI